MVAILEKGEFNSDFHPMVDFIAASPLRYALTVKPTIFVSYIQQFWSTARIETTDEGTHILATVDGIQRTVSESSLRRNLKLRDKDGIVSIPDTELFENLTLMGYNISQHQKLTFQKGQFSHQWKYLIHTIMQCLSPKSTGFNEFSSNIATALVCLATNRTYNFFKMIFDGMVKNATNKVSKFLMYPRFLTKCLRMSQFIQISHTHQYVVPFHTKKLFTTLRVNSPSFSGRLVPFFDTMLIQQVEGSGTPTEPHHTPSPEVTSSHPSISSIPLSSIPTAPIHTVTQSDTTPIIQYTKRARIAQGAPAERISNDSEDIARVLTSMDAATILAGEANVPTGSGFIPTASPPATIVSTGSEVGPITSLIVQKRKGKEILVESDTPKKKKLQEQIDAQVARELEEQQEREDMRMNEQIARDAEVARIHAEEEIHAMIDSLDKSNETVAKYLQEYQQFALDLSLVKKIELISDLLKYQKHYKKVYKFQSQQRKPMSKKQKREYYMAVIKSYLGWRDSPFDLEAYSDNDYAGANLDRKSTTNGCQFLGRRLILWQCKKQTIVAILKLKQSMLVLLTTVDRFCGLKIKC
nr:ribonuclease H-like domain, reverse transcriptase, RNA-dependent DNA polymerase [Tanacetum cinerariifolium]